VLIAQDLPPVLERIGVHLEPESAQVTKVDAEELLKRFQARPAKYAGLEITVSFKVTGDVHPVDEGTCSALKLPLGDAIERQVQRVDRRISRILAAREMADWLEELPKKSDVTARITLLWGIAYSDDWSDREFNQTRSLVLGYQIIEIIESKENVDM
jgi:hypothetical protein